MFDVTNFLMRWLFLCNLIRDAAEIQTLPYQPNAVPRTTVSPASSHPQHQSEHHHHQQQPQPQQGQHQSTSKASTSVCCEDEWRDQCFRWIVSYPPGSQRSLIMDAMRAELVEQLAWSLQEADLLERDDERHRRRENERKAREEENGSFHPDSSSSSGNVGRIPDNGNPFEQDLEVDDPYLDADVEIMKAIELETQLSTPTPINDDSSAPPIDESEQAALVISENGTSIEPATDSPTGSFSSLPSPALVHSEIDDEISDRTITPEAVDDARKTIRTVRDYLPQLVSVVLKSPPAFDPNLLNPVDKLRKVIVRRCIDDANWGVDMCWLLEAEVGRAWKTLFEHRQQTGRRLIVVLPAEKAAVLAKIGSGKREAFDLLQDAEQATAFGYTAPLEEYLFSGHGHGYQQQPQFQQQPNVDYQHGYGTNGRLPSSLSLRRCSHFGDTMHFIDRLTKISLDLRLVPLADRDAYMKHGLDEMNRRVRRRMVTRGDVSLDVEDHRGPDDWPRISDITADKLTYSVHLPLDPKRENGWPGGASMSEITNGGATRVLNIVVDECRILASRERCPYLVHVEVAETGLRGNDPRLYASGAPGLGATIGEALSLSASAAAAGAATGSSSQEQVCAPYHIPSELLDTSIQLKVKKSVNEEAARNDIPTNARIEMPRGGWQTNETVYYSDNPDDVFASNPYNAVRENEYQQLHEQMYFEQGMIVQNSDVPEQSRFHSTREALLDRVFGQTWNEKCEEIRQASPYGKVQGWRLASFIVKAGEDIRREALVMQIINKLSEWFQTDIPESHRPHMRPYTIMCVGGEAGLVECLSDAKSVDEVKKKTDGFMSLRDYFERAYGPPTTHSNHYKTNSAASRDPERMATLTFEEAQDNFLRSLVGYSLVCYILQIKDRHNANILMDREGNIMHIDFGFVLGDTPKMAKVPIFSEKAPFKLSQEFWEVLGGWNIKQGGLGVRFCHMFEYAFACAASHTDEIASLVEATMLTLTQSPRHARNLANGVRHRLRMRGKPGSNEQKFFIMELITAALTDFTTATYDWLQRNMNGYQ